MNDPRLRVANGVSRRRFLVGLSGPAAGLLALACAPSAPAQPTAAPAKPAAEPTKPALPAASPAASPVAAAPSAKPASLPNLSGVSLNVLQWSSFIPEADPFFKKQIEDDFMKQTGARVTIEFVNADDLQPKAAAAIQSGSGPDVFLLQY